MSGSVAASIGTFMACGTAGVVLYALKNMLSEAPDAPEGPDSEAPPQIINKELQEFLDSYQLELRTHVVGLTKLLTAVYPLRTANPVACDETLRRLERILFIAYQLSTKQQPPSMTASSLAKIRYVDMGKHMKAWKDSVKEGAQLADINKLIQKIDEMAQSHLQVVVSRCSVRA